MASQFTISTNHYPRIVALGGTLALMAVVILLALRHVSPLLRESAHHLVPVPSVQKNQGILIQQEAFAAPDILPVYGSSELNRPALNRPSEFFASAPTGFQVCPVGVAGNTSLLILMKIAALGEVVSGHKMVVLLSPGWFSRPCTPADHYAGNFSALHAINTVESSLLTKGLRRRIAMRMLDYPETLESHPLLLLRARALAGENPIAGTVNSILNDALKINAETLTWEDAIQSMLALKKPTKPSTPWKAELRDIPWAPLMAEAKAVITPSKRHVFEWKGKGPSPVDGAKRREFDSGEKGEWTDFVLLLDTIHELKIDALIISMPLSGARDDLEGVEPVTRHRFYYSRVEALCRERGVAVNTFENHDLDKDFLIDYVSHPSPVGWLHINRVLDDFWHNRPPPQS